MIIYKKDSSLSIPVGLGPNVSQAPAHPLQNKQVDPSTSELNVKADSAYYGLNQVTVNGVTSSIDSNIIESNIRKDVTILGVTGNLESETVNNQDKTVNSSTTEQNITADNGYSGLGTVTVNPYTLDNKSVNPSTNSQTVTSDEDGLASVTVNPVTAAIDPDIIASNIRKDVDILGVVGNFEGGTLQSKTVNSSTVSQTVEPDGANYGLSSVTVNPYSVEAKSDTITINGQYSYSPSNSDALSGVTIDVQVADIPAIIQTKSVTYNHNGNYTITKDNGYDGMSSVDVSVYVDTTITLEPAKTVNSSTVSQTVTYDNTNYDGLSSVTVNPYTLENKTVNSSTVSQSVTASTADGLAMVTVNPYTLDSKTVDPSTNSQTVTSSEDGLSSVTVNAVDSNIDPNILSNNIKNGVTILGITGSYVGQVINNQNKTVDSSTVSQSVTADNGYTGLETVTVNAVTSSIDSNITAGNIKNGVTILGVTGSYSGQSINNQNKTVNSSTVSQSISSDSGYTGLGTVTVNPYTLDSKTVDSSTVSQTINSSADGLLSVTVNPYTLQAKTVTYADTLPITPDAGYNGFSSVDITLQQKSVDASIRSVSVVSDDPYFALDSVIIRPVTAAIDSNITAGNIKNGVTILGVTGTLTSDNYIYEVKTGARTSLTTDFAGLTNYGYELYSLFRNSALESLTATMSTWGNTPDNKDYLMADMCVLCNNLESVSFPNWTGSTNANEQFYSTFSNCYKIASVNFPEMTVAHGFNDTFSFSGDHSADASANFNKLEIINEGGMGRCFYQSGFTSINMPLLQTVNYGGLSYAFYGHNSSLGSMTFPSLTTCPNNNDNVSAAFDHAFSYNSNITSVSFPELTTIGNNCFSNTFYNATGLTTLNLPKLSVFSRAAAPDATPFGSDNSTFLYGCTALTNLTIHPASLARNILTGAPNITNLIITADATDNIHLDWQSSLTEASVLSVLTHLDLNTSGKSVTFYTGGLSVRDDAQDSIRIAYDNAVHAGWTISNLTVIAYS